MTTSELIDHVDGAVAKALAGESLMHADVLALHGFATPTQRRLVNNLTRMPGGCAYLEVGLYAGATFCAALSNNPDLLATGIENHSQDFSRSGIPEELAANFKRFQPDAFDANIIYADAFATLLPTEFPFDAYYFDGEHSEESQAKALPAFVDAMAPTFLYMVDDADWTPVNVGTCRGFDTLGDRVRIDRRWHLTDGRPDGPTWHNGVAIFACSKL
jgi:hypothetical protein